jgi:tRNA threonylcarbamoyladenosine biosynthesis protein TsaE
MTTYSSHSLDETQETAAKWLNQVANDVNTGKSDGATVVGLSGHLGAGKTAFVKIVAKLLGVKEEVTSPTFVIMKIYEVNTTIQIRQPAENDLTIQNLPWERLIHIDAYRLEKSEELEVLNFEQLVADPHNLIMVEWPENVALESLVLDHQKIRFEVVGAAYGIFFR